MKVLLTGGLGFIGSAMVRKYHQDWDITVLDSFTYAADPNRITGARCRVIRHDITAPIPAFDQFDVILHLAAETHVDRSIENPEPFVMTNVLGTMRMLDFARTQKNLKAFLYFSTDEVYGPAAAGYNFNEGERYNSGNPYAASKAGGEELTLAYGNTYKVPIIITHTMNAFGPFQHLEKFVPNTIQKILKGQEVIIHADPTLTISGSRFYIHVDNIATAVAFVLEHGTIREKYNIVGEKEVSNLDLANNIANRLGKTAKTKLVDFHSSRPGHDLRYGLDGAKLEMMGWHLPETFEDSLNRTIDEYAYKLAG